MMIFVTGDTHGNEGYSGNRDFFDKLSLKKFEQGRELTKEDYVIIAGDFGFLFRVKESDEERYFLDWMDKTAPWTTLFVDGNHENFDRLNSLEETDMFNGKVGVVNDSVFHLKRGHIYNICGQKIFTFGGASSIDKNRRRLGVSWWREEMPSFSEMKFGLYNLKKHKNKVDYVITHTGPAKIIKELATMYEENPLTSYLDVITETIKFKKWFFGHFHEDKKIREDYESVYYNVIRLESK